MSTNNVATSSAYEQYYVQCYMHQVAALTASAAMLSRMQQQQHSLANAKPAARRKRPRKRRKRVRRKKHCVEKQVDSSCSTLARAPSVGGQCDDATSTNIDTTTTDAR